MRLILALTFITPFSVFANVPQEFKSSALVIPGALLGKGYRKFGDLELTSFIERAQGMKVVAKATVAHPQDMGGGMMMERNLAQWRRTAMGDVTVSNRWQKTPAGARPIASLHEALGALGFEDDIFTCSGALLILSDDEAREVLTASELAHFENIAQSNCKRATAGGGTTGVTGGGDDYPATVRVRALRNTIKEIREGGDREGAVTNLRANLYQSFEKHRNIEKSKGKSIFHPNYKHTKQCLPPERGLADESTIKVWYQGQPVPKDSRNGWTYDAATNCIHYHGTAVRGWGGNAVMYGRRQ